jgi:mRNA-degrading endonuclease HigB of HigAB toxin-antitoxin module
LLRFLAQQAAVCVVRHNADFRARFLALTKRQNRPLETKQAYVAVANKLLRTLWVLSVTGQSYRSQVTEAA